MKILLVDFISPKAHFKFNCIHISALLSLGYDIDLLCKSCDLYSKEYGKKIRTFEFPQRFFTKLPLRPLTERILGFIRSIWLLSYLNKYRYDAVVFLSYDVISLIPFRTKSQVFLINHNNVSQLNHSRVKLFLTRSLPLNYIHIALSETMKERMEVLLSHKKVEYVPHGIITNKEMISKPAFIDENQRFLFCPVNSNYDAVLLKEVLDSDLVRDYISKENLCIFVKKHVAFLNNHARIIQLSSFLTSLEYNYMINNSLAIILPYSKAFKYRCSGIFFECVANDQTIISTSIPDMLSYSKNARICYFDNPISFVSCLENLNKVSQKDVDKEEYCPKKFWLKVFKKYSSVNSTEQFI